MNIGSLTKDISKIDLADVCSDWNWCLQDMQRVLMISLIGDMFFLGKNGKVYWLRTDTCSVLEVAEDPDHFSRLMSDDAVAGEWLLPGLVEELIAAGKLLQENQVYSFNIPPSLGGEYSADNIGPVDISIHFSIAGQICRQIKDLPGGTRISIKLE